MLIHTGSRGHGYGVFRSLEEQWAEGFSPDSPHGKEYITRHNEAVQWARVNRLAVASRIAEALRTDIELVTDAAHNTVQHHQDGWLHRKGAAAPDCGLAPLAGSRDDYSYLMEVQDNPQALWSTSHGAGRRYDRASMHGRIRKVKSELVSLQRNKFGGQILCSDRDLLIEEAGPAYKSAASVMQDLEDLGVAREIAKMTPLLTFKTTRQGTRK